MGLIENPDAFTQKRFPITPRQGLNFHLDEEIPKYWFEGDVFKTRFFDTVSIRLPVGERFTVACVRDYADQIDDPKLLQQTKDLIRQEGIHSLMHRRLNERLTGQGIPVEEMYRRNNKFIDRFRTFRRPIPLAQTTAGEHLTSTLAHLLFEHPELFKNADARVMSLFMWHAAEEIEHKAVPFTVLVNVAKAGYYTRIFVCMLMTPAFFLHTFFLMNKIFKIDGFGMSQRFGLWRRGLPWLFGAGGLLRLMAPEYLKFYRRDFDPWMSGDTTGYERWLEGYSRNHDPIEAGQHALAI